MASHIEHALHGCAHLHSFVAEMHHPAFPLPGDEPQYAPDRPIDITHIKLDLALDFDQQRISGTVTLHARVLAAQIRSITLDAVELEIAAAQIRLDHAGDLIDVPWTIHDTQIELKLDQALSRDAQFEIMIRYSAQPRRGVYFIQPDEGYPHKQVHTWTQGQDIDARAWFPCHTLPDDKATTELVARVPTGMFALSNGALIDRRDNDDGTTSFHWRETTPHSAYLVMLAAGPFVEIADEWDGLPVTYYVLPGREADARRAMSRTPEMIKLFSDRLGVRYPYEKYAQVCVSDFIFGGMENTSATTLTDTFMPDERVLPDWTNETLVAHELAHQWFGDLVTCREWGHGWLNEGFATYFEAIWIEHAEGEDAFRYKLWEDAQRYMNEDRDRYRRPIVTRTYRQPIDVFDMHLYPKGGWVLHMLRAQLGDAAWKRALNHYLIRHREGTVLTHDLQRAIEEATGRNVDKFFDQWIYGGGHPELEVSYTWLAKSNSAQITIKQTQMLDDVTPLFDLPLTIRFETEHGSHDHQTRIKDAEHSFTFALPGAPKLVRVDPDGDVLKTIAFKRPLALLTYQLQHDRSIWGRIEAAQELARLNSRAATDALANALPSEPFWGVQVQIANALGSIRTPAARTALLDQIGIEQPRVRRAVIEALANFRRDAAVADAVWQRLSDGDPSYYVEAFAATTLGKLRTPDAFDRISRALDRSSWNDVIRMHALIGLGELRDPRGVPIAIHWSSYGKELWARLGAITALGQLGALDSQRAEVVEHLCDLLDDPALRVREAVTQALATIGDARAIPALRRATTRDLDGRIVRKAREAIRRIEANTSRSAELRALRDDVDRLIAENRQLRDRIETIEKGRPGGEARE